MKSTKLGVGFTGQETEQQLVEKIQLLSERIVQMGAGAQGFGGGVTFQRFEDAFGLSRENFMVAQKFGRNIEGLRRDNNKAAAENLKGLDASRAVEVGMRDIQSTAVEVQQGIAATLSPLSTLIPAILTALVAANVLLGIMAFKGTGIGGSMKGMGTKLAGSGAVKLGVAGVAGTMMLKDAADMATGTDGGMSGKNIGGVAGGAIGAAIGSVLLPGNMEIYG